MYLQCFISLLDKEKPRKIRCPDNIIKKTVQQQEIITWQEPIFEDNCGDYSKCNVRVSSNRPNGGVYQVNSQVQIKYTAIDPSNNINEECTFTVSIKRRFFQKNSFKIVTQNI